MSHEGALSEGGLPVKGGLADDWSATAAAVAALEGPEFGPAGPGFGPTAPDPSADPCDAVAPAAGTAASNRQPP